ncbi:MAG: hypothetical protein IT282_09790 [Bacteroidetes bacterium]|nr:hypothetical protein [Bacteroidota bacterium]
MNSNLRKEILMPIVVSVAMIGCKDSSSNPGALLDVPQGTYAYIARDTTGVPVVCGWLAIALSDTGRVSGSWHLQALQFQTGYGPQVGEGELRGSIVDTTLHVNLNPQWKDNNVFLSGRFDSASYSGQWRWVSYIGVTNVGSFTAVKK